MPLERKGLRERGEQNDDINVNNREETQIAKQKWNRMALEHATTHSL